MRAARSLLPGTLCVPTYRAGARASPMCPTGASDTSWATTPGFDVHGRARVGRLRVYPTTGRPKEPTGAAHAGSRTLDFEVSRLPRFPGAPSPTRFPTVRWSAQIGPKSRPMVRRSRRKPHEIQKVALPDRRVTVHSEHIGNTFRHFAGDAKCRGRSVTRWTSYVIRSGFLGTDCEYRSICSPEDEFLPTCHDSHSAGSASNLLGSNPSSAVRRQYDWDQELGHCEGRRRGGRDKSTGLPQRVQVKPANSSASR